MRGRVPVIGREGSTAFAAADGDSIRIAGNPAFSTDPDLELAINSVPAIPVSKELLAKSGWTSCEGQVCHCRAQPRGIPDSCAKTPKVRHSYDMALQGWGMV